MIDPFLRSRMQLLLFLSYFFALILIKSFCLNSNEEAVTNSAFTVDYTKSILNRILQEEEVDAGMDAETDGDANRNEGRNGRRRRRKKRGKRDDTRQIVLQEGEGSKSDIHPASDQAIATATSKFTCKNDSMLSYVTANPPTRAVMFIISHNNDSDVIANQYRECYGTKWIYVARLSKSIYFESVIYQNFFPQHENMWTQYDYVVTATYKTLTRQLLPRYMPLQTMQHVKQMLYTARDKNYDIYPFFRDFEELIPTSIRYHGPNFLKVWHLLLQQLGYSLKTIQRFYYVKGFYRNAFIIRPKILQKLMNFMQQAMFIAESHEEIRQLLSTDAHYVLGKKEIAMDIFNTSYYQLYPFVFERLPIFFIYVNNYKVCIGPDSPCKYNYKG